MKRYAISSIFGLITVLCISGTEWLLGNELNESEFLFSFVLGYVSCLDLTRNNK